PDLLPVDDPEIALQIGARGRAREIGAAAGFAEELAPGVFTGEDAAQELFLLRVTAMLEQGCRSEQPDSRSCDADGAHIGKLFLDHPREADGEATSVPFLGPLRHTPA